MKTKQLKWIALARNLLTLFVFYEILTLSTYPLVTHHRTEKAKRSGRVYMGVLMSTSIGMFLLGLTWTWWRTGTLEFQPGGILDGVPTDYVAAQFPALYAHHLRISQMPEVQAWMLAHPHNYK